MSKDEQAIRDLIGTWNRATASQLSHLPREAGQAHLPD